MLTTVSFYDLPHKQTKLVLPLLQMEWRIHVGYIGLFSRQEYDFYIVIEFSLFNLNKDQII